MRFTLAFAIVTQVFAQTSPDASALLTQSAEALQRYHSYQLTQDTSMDMNMPGIAFPGSGTLGMTMTMVIQVVNPNKVRMEMKTSGVDGMLAVSDGTQTWMYMPLLKQYTKSPADSGDVKDLMSGMGMVDVPDMKQTAANAKVIGSELLELDGRQHDCWVVESRTDKITPPEPGGQEMQDVVYTAWIDKSLGIQLKASMSAKSKANPSAPVVPMRTLTTTHSLKLDADLPDSLFVFTPPAGATETKELFPEVAAVAASAPPPDADKAAPRAPGEPEAFVPLLNPIDRIEPVYPPEARSQGVQGMVELLVTIDPSGEVVKAEPLSGREVLRPAAMDAVKKWKFRPVYRDGHPVAAYTQTMVDFSLDTGKPGSAGDFDIAGQTKSSQRTQELAARFPRSPEQVLADSEEQIRGADASDRFDALPDLAKQAFDAGALDKASSYATELLKLANDNAGDWNYGNAIYTGNMVLGLVALRQGSASQARLYLLESGKTKGSPTLDSFGPDFTLAQGLLAKGERDAVLEFLTQCKSFWKMGADRLDSMIEAVRKGEAF